MRYSLRTTRIFRVFFFKHQSVHFGDLEFDEIQCGFYEGEAWDDPVLVLISSIYTPENRPSQKESNLPAISFLGLC